MANVQANGIQIEYDTFGKRSGRPLLLVMGLGAQMIHWRAEFCEQLADAGHFVVRYDNRDVGLSTKFDAAGLPDIAAIMTQMAAGEPVSAPYTLNDMADDGFGLLDALDLPAAHICGASMGGMIVQAMAIRQPPNAIKSLTSIMSSTGNRELPPAKPEAMAALMSPAGTNRDEVLARSVSVSKVIGSPGLSGRSGGDARACARSVRARVLSGRRCAPDGCGGVERQSQTARCRNSTSRRSSFTARQIRWCRSKAASIRTKRCAARS